MKMKKETAIKILAAMLTILMVTMCMQATVFANDTLSLDQVKGESSKASEATQSAANIILGVFQVVAVSVAVIMLIWLAIKYISSAPDDKAQIKKSAIIYIVGAVLLFASTGILQIIKQFADDAFNGGK